MRKIGLGLIFLGIILFLGSISFLPKQNHMFDIRDIVKIVFITGSYLLSTMVGLGLIVLEKIKK